MVIRTKILLIVLLVFAFSSFKPEKQCIDTVLNTKDSILFFINKGMENNEFPGAQVIIISENKLLMDSCFGYTTYENQHKVDDNTIYDLASLTKCFATTFMAMKLYEEGKFDVCKTLEDYIPEYDDLEVGNLPMLRFLTHSTGLTSSLSLQYQLLVAEGKDAQTKNWFKGILHDHKQKGYSTVFSKTKRESLYIYDKLKFTDYITCKSRGENYVELADTVFITPKFYEKVVDSALMVAKKYSTGRRMYSDINFYYLKEVLERNSGMEIDEYLNKEIYSELLLDNIMYEPLEHGVDIEDIAPTEYDALLRKRIVQGTVHDEFAAIMGGIEGNAGLFSNARDLVPLCREMLDTTDNFFKAETKKLFLSRPYIGEKNFRALGFQRTDSTRIYRQSSFGHSGFTGTYFQVEPKTKTILIF